MQSHARDDTATGCWVLDVRRQTGITAKLNKPPPDLCSISFSTATKNQLRGAAPSLVAVAVDVFLVLAQVGSGLFKLGPVFLDLRLVGLALGLACMGCAVGRPRLLLLLAVMFL